MPASTAQKTGKPAVLAKVQRFYQRFSEFAEDFWKDGDQNPLSIDAFRPFFKRRGPKAAETIMLAETMTTVEASAPIIRWHAAPGEIAEKMWGKGQTLPCDATLAEDMLKPLALTKSSAVVDIAAGLGFRMIKITKEYGCDLTGLDSDATLALRGTELVHAYSDKKFTGIAAYNPQQIGLLKEYNVLLARELFYRVPDKVAFLRKLGTYAEPIAQLSFTDYVIDPEHRDAPAIKAWMQAEKDAEPLGLVEMAETWNKAGFNLRLYDDKTDMYRAEILAGIKRLSVFLTTVRPDPATKQIILKNIELWAQRLAAFDAGMKFYRVYGIKE